MVAAPWRLSLWGPQPGGLAPRLGSERSGTAEVVVARRFQPAPPTGETLDVWPDAAAWAERYWREVRANEALEDGVRAFAGEALGAVAELASRVSPRGS